MIVKVKKVTDSAIVPTKGTIGSAGFDLYIDSAEDVVIDPHCTKLLQTNIIFEIPKGYFGAIFARSGLSSKKGIRPATCVSVIDSDYRGIVGIPLHNDSKVPVIISPFERVAQMIIMESPEIELKEVDFVSITDRGENGYGSTGTK